MAARRVWSNGLVPAGRATSSTVAGPIAWLKIKRATGLISKRRADDGLRELPSAVAWFGATMAVARFAVAPAASGACASGCSASSDVAHATRPESATDGLPRLEGTGERVGQGLLVGYPPVVELSSCARAFAPARTSSSGRAAWSQRVARS
jgi:hypothetical protein